MHTRLPGTRLLAFARRWFAPQTMALVFDPLVADWQREWIEALSAHRARIRLRGTVAFVVAALALTPRMMLLPPPASMTRRVLSRTIAVTTLIASLLTIPLLVGFRDLPLPQLLVGALTLLPAGMALGFPFSTIWATDGIRRHASATPAERATALRFGIIAVIVTLTLLGWVIPAANQRWRELAAPEWARPPARGVREITLTELIRHPPPRIVEGRDPKLIRREINSRLVIALLPAVLIWLRWGAHNVPRKRWISPLPVVVETIGAGTIFFPLYLLSVAIEPALGLNAGTGMWFALFALIMAGLLRIALSKRFITAALG